MPEGGNVLAENLRADMCPVLCQRATPKCGPKDIFEYGAGEQTADTGCSAEKQIRNGTATLIGDGVYDLFG